MNKGSTSRTKNNIIYSLKNREHSCIKPLYDDYSPKLLGVISLIVANEEMRLEILEKTFTRIYLDINAYEPIHSTLFTWMIRVATSVSAECMDVPICEMQDKFWGVYKAQKTNIQKLKPQNANKQLINDQ